MSISLIVPCYNEELNLQKGVLDKIGNFSKNDDRFQEIIVVDDGSTDKSKTIIKDKYLSQFNKFKLIENDHQGKAHSLITGIKEAKSNYIAFTDMDLATPIEEINKLINETKGNEIVIGSRSSERKGAPLTRKIMALGGIIIRDILLDLKGIKDTQCGFKLFSRKAALDIIKRLRVSQGLKKIHGSSVSASFDMEFLFIASKLKYRIKEIPVVWRHVETKNVNFIRDSIETLKDIAKIKYFDLMGKYANKK